MKRWLICLLGISCLAGCSAAAVETEKVDGFTIVIENQTDDRIHGVGYEFAYGSEKRTGILCTEQDGGWVEIGQTMEQEFDLREEAFSAEVFVVSGGSAEFCEGTEIQIHPKNGETYHYTLLGTQGGYVLQ